jgi:hypothetical protein
VEKKLNVLAINYSKDDIHTWEKKKQDSGF